MNLSLRSQREQKPLTVSEVAELLNRVISLSVPPLSFVGEIAECKQSPQGHIYLTVKDQASQLSAVLWRSAAQRVSFTLKVGQLVHCVGKATFWTVKGRCQIQIERISEAGAGELQRRFLELKARLEAEGLFAVERKRSIPFLPRAIGLVTSRHGAALHDMLVKFRERMPCVPIFLADARVQGDGAAAEIADGIRRFNAADLVDVIIVGRGGGSIEDLWAFNEEPVVRAIFASRIPVVSAVGHEVDVSLADLAADVRAPTPTAAAEMVVPHRGELLRRIVDLEGRLSRVEAVLQSKAQELDETLFRLGVVSSRVVALASGALQQVEARVRALEPTQRLANLRLLVNGSEARLFHLTAQRIARGRAELARVEGRISPRGTVVALKQVSERIETTMRRMARAVVVGIEARKQRLSAAEARCAAADPRAVVRRGYAIVRRSSDLSGPILRDAARVRPGDRVAVELATGALEAEVVAIQQGVLQEESDGKAGNS